MTVSVVIPTYRRPEHLQRAVATIRQGNLLPDEIVVVCRPEDREASELLAALPATTGGRAVLRQTYVKLPGHVPAVEAGVKSASGEVVAIIDDDVTITPGWLEQLLRPFGDPAVGVVGGRAIVPGYTLARLKGRPGQLSWYGKHWGNIGSVDGSKPFEVASVQECNWAWRRELICSLEFSKALNFDDAVMYGMDLCLQARARGFRVLYNPLALVYHHLAPRSPELDRADRPRRLFAYCRNYTYIMLRRLPWQRRIIFLAWWFFIGERGGWGLGAIAADTLLNGLRWRGEAAPALRGKIQGIRLSLSRRRAEDPPRLHESPALRS